MQPILNVEDVAQVESALIRVGVSLAELMRRAGAAVAHECLHIPNIKNVVVLAGFGNNAGDGWVAAQELKAKGLRVSVVTPLEVDKISSDLARVVAQKAHKAGIGIMVAPPRDQLERVLADADVVVDAMLGTGFHGKLRAPFNIWIDVLNASGAHVISVDVPSGLSAQTGLAEGSFVVADTTVTMLVLKPGLLSDKGRDACGSIIVAPLAEQTERIVIDADPVAWRPDLVDYLPAVLPPSAALDKYLRGSVLVVGGSAKYPGAAVLAARAAARAGAGYVTLAVPSYITGIIQAQLPEIPVVGLPATSEGVFSEKACDQVAELAKKHSASLIGPGMGVSAANVALVSALLETDCPLVIDADGLNCLARLTSNHLDDFPEIIRRKYPLILTPHRKELGRLVGLADTPPNSLTSALEATRRIVWSDGGSELCIIAKGSASACVSAELALMPKPGPSALATAGSGDVLSGILVAELAQTKLECKDLPLLSAYCCEVHGQAGAIAAERFGSRAVMAGDIIDAIGLAADALDRQISYPADMDV